MKMSGSLNNAFGIKFRTAEEKKAEKLAWGATAFRAGRKTRPRHMQFLLFFFYGE